MASATEFIGLLPTDVWLIEQSAPHSEVQLMLLLSCALFVQLIKTHNLLPSRNYIFGYHPHGIFCFGAFCNFGTEATGFSKKFPGIKPSLATLAGNFRMPVLRDYLMSGGGMIQETIMSRNV